MTDFAHLHVHTDSSLLDGAASCKDLAKKAALFGMKHLAITDHGNMFGVLKFRDACKDAGIHPVIGCEFYMAQGSRHERSSLKHNIALPADDDEKSEGKSYHLVLLSTCEQGYRNLMQLSSYSFMEGFYYKPRIDEELLVKYHEGLICLSACVAGEIPRLILAGKKDEAKKKALWFQDLFGKDNYFLEIQDHGLKVQRDSNPAIIEIAKKTGIGLVVTNDVHYLEQKDSIAHDVLLCIGTKKKRSDEKRMRFEGDQFYLKSGDEMAALFPEYPEAVENTLKIAERCSTEIPEVDTNDLVNYLPDFEIPKEYSNMNEYLRAETYKGINERYPLCTDAVNERVEYELKVIIEMGFTGYFLIVADFINWAKKNDIPVGPGRGSGAGSIVAYSLRITDVEPLKYGLLFERFLNPERVSMPDFDVDFCQARRAEVIDYVTNKYGRNRVGQIITFSTLSARAVIKDVARVLDIPLTETNTIVQMIPELPKMTLKKAFESEPKLSNVEKDPRYQELFDIARKLEGKSRNSGLHAAGVVIGKEDLINYVPLYKDPTTGGIASQFTMEQLESCGLVKMDFLGLVNLDIIKNAVALVRKKSTELANFEIEKIPENDKLTFDMLAEGKSSAVFQFESDGMRNVLVQAKPNKIDELAALNALFRPGPMANIPKFVDSKNGKKAIEYPDPCLEPYLKETYGVIVYQEQVMQVAQTIAGYSLGRADILRRAMSKKKRAVIDAEKVPFIEGAVKKGFKAEFADKIYEELIPFADYGFNKSHAVAYSIVAYQTAYLKANFPVEYMASILTSAIYKTDDLPKYIDEARKMGIEIDPPDVNKSEKLFSVHNGKVVYGFLGIKGIGEAPAEEIIARRKDGAYKNFTDFIERVDQKTCGKKVTELLVQTGAFDSFGVGRSTLNGNLEKAIEFVQKKKEDKNSGIVSLFEDTNEKEYTDFKFISLTEWSNDEKLQKEKELLGFYFSGHPLDTVKEIWEKYSQLKLDDVENAIAGMEYIVVGIVKTLRSIQVKKGASAGRQMGSGSVSDYNGDMEMTFFPDTWERCRDSIAVDKIVAIKGKLDRRNEKPAIIVKEILDPMGLDVVIENTTETGQKTFKGAPSLAILDPYKDFWARACPVNLSHPETSELKKEYTFVGILTSLKPHEITKEGKNKGKLMGFGSLADYNGQIDITFYHDQWKKYSETVQPDTVIVFKGTLEGYNGKRVIVFKELIETTKLDDMAWKEVHIRLQPDAVKSENDLVPLRDCILNHSGNCYVFIHVPVVGNEAVIRTTTHLSAAADAAHIDAIKKCLAVAEVWRV